ncbi:hypothetical protein [Nocardia sp. NPDC051833]|uniref:hypothetical protein n=1 Tax=Nocardia sp. NPDC051833 TaxID=3155674 RepID=UPI00341885DD
MTDIVTTMAELHALPIGTVLYTRGHNVAVLTNDLLADARGAYMLNLLNVRTVWSNDLPAEVIRIPDPDYALLLEQAHERADFRSASDVLTVVRAQVEAKRAHCRNTGTRNLGPGTDPERPEYKNSIRTGYDRALTEVLTLIDEQERF